MNEITQRIVEEVKAKYARMSAVDRREAIDKATSRLWAHGEISISGLGRGTGERVAVCRTHESYYLTIVEELNVGLEAGVAADLHDEWVVIAIDEAGHVEAVETRLR